MRGRLLSSPICERSIGNGIFFTIIRAPYTMRPINPNCITTSINVIHFGLVLSNFGVKLSRVRDTMNENRKQYTAAHATPNSFAKSYITTYKEKMRVKVGGRPPNVLVTQLVRVSVLCRRSETCSLRQGELNVAGSSPARNRKAKLFVATFKLPDLVAQLDSAPAF